MKIIKELYDYREMLSNLVKKDLKVRYKGSVLGFLWTFLNPLLQLIVYTIVFSTIMKVNIDKFYIYLFIGLIPWLFFATCIQAGSTSILMNKDLIKKIFNSKFCFHEYVLQHDSCNIDNTGQWYWI